MSATAGRRTSPTGSRSCTCTPDGREDAISYGWLRETSNRLANVLRAHGVGAATASRSCCRRRRKSPPRHIAIYKLGAIALPLAMLFGADALSYRLQNSGAKALITNAQGLAKLADIRDAGARTHVRAVDRRRRRWRRQLCRSAGARLIRFHAGRHRRRRSGDDDLHLRHHRPAQRRAARPSRFARPSSRHRAAAL